VVRAHREFDTGRPLTWAMAGGLALVLVGSGALYARLTGGPARSEPSVT
jgi:hypothetical protein